MKAGVWILVALTFAASAVAQAPQERPDWKLFFSGSGGRWNDCHCGRAFWRDAGLRCGTCQKRFMPASTFKVLMPCLRSMPERSVTFKGDSVGWRGRTLTVGIRIRPALIHEALDGMGVSAVCP